MIVQASDEGIALLGAVQSLGRNNLNRSQRVLDAMFHLAHDQLLPHLTSKRSNDTCSKVRLWHLADIAAETAVKR